MRLRQSCAFTWRSLHTDSTGVDPGGGGEASVCLARQDRSPISRQVGLEVQVCFPEPVLELAQPDAVEADGIDQRADLFVASGGEHSVRVYHRRMVFGRRSVTVTGTLRERWI